MKRHAVVAMNKVPAMACALLIVVAVAEAGPAATNRPRVGLALSGGGALGLAHVGVLKELEKHRVPIDCIAGTSMGAIVAGLYACGMGPDEMETFLEGLDWNHVMSDATPRRELYFRRKLDDQRYLFEMGLGRKGLKIGTGMAAGQKFNNLMQLITLRSVSITNFNDLPIPYRAVATDLAAGKPVVIDRGNLATAMRASMALPGIFTPVAMEGRLLVDGAVVQNLPVDVVRAMGADIVIAVDVGSRADSVEPEQLQTLGGILGRTYAVAQRPNTLEQLGRADIAIQPNLDGFSHSQFHRNSELISRGENAARQSASQLAALGVDEQAYAAYLSRQRRALPGNLRIGGVSVTGNRRVSEKSIRKRILTRPDRRFDEDLVQLDLMRIYGIGEFEQVLFLFDPGADGEGVLHYDVTEKPWGPLYLAYGLNLRSDFDNDSDWTMLVNLTRRSLNRFGAEWRNEFAFGSRWMVLSEFYQPLDYGGFTFTAPLVTYRSEREELYDGGERIADYDVRRLEGRLDFGLQLRHYAELRAGPFWGMGRASVETGASDLPSVDDDYAGLRVGLIVDRRDRTLFACEGYYYELEGLFADESMGGSADFDKVAGVARHHQSVGNHTFTLGLQGGTSLGSDLPGYAQFKLGGPFGFAGLAEGQFRGSYLGVGSLGYRYRLLELPAQVGKGVYALIRFDAGNVWNDGVEIEDLRYGAALGIGADTALGPAYLGYGTADEGYGRFYFSLGTAF
ncbi:MAG: patatin-like phospholipase family protein [Phycisphaerae bacterium]|nr:patatin-like phospholipase family protein [Phycisphaerae bacterium]